MLSIAVVTAALAAALTVRTPRRRPHEVRPAADNHVPSAVSHQIGGQRWWTSPWLAAGLAALAAAQLVGGPSGLLVGVAAGVGAHRWVAGAESSRSRRLRAEVERDLPLAVDLLVACVAAGRSPDSGLVTVADALPGALGDRLRETSARLSLGADPEVVWRDLATDPALAPLGHTLARSARTGASISTTLTRCADDLRRQRRAHAETTARSVGVRAAAPLGVCFLPAFLLIGVVPTIVGAFGALSS